MCIRIKTIFKNMRVALVLEIQDSFAAVSEVRVIFSKLNEIFYIKR